MANHVKGAEVHNFYGLKAVSIEGEEISLEKFKGKKTLVVNLASQCGKTYQYEQLQELYEHQRINILGFPCNDFGGQEPGSEEEIVSFCTKNYGVTFPLFKKMSLETDNLNPVYNFLSNKDLNGWNTELPSWNFCKYLIDENGTLINFFGSGIEPFSNDILDKI